MDSLYDDAELYDLVAPRDPAMERFYVGAAGDRVGGYWNSPAAVR